jgi:hypothetical protein
MIIVKGGITMNSYFQIIDEKGVIESPLHSLDEAFERLEFLDEDESFQQAGDLKIVEVHYIRA